MNIDKSVMSCVAMNIQTLQSVCLGNQVWPEPQRAKKKGKTFKYSKDRD